jgi:hypothetical protein
VLKTKAVNIAVIIKYYNEQISISQIVKDFQSALPNSTIYTYDNNWKDSTIEVAFTASAIVRSETHQVKDYCSPPNVQRCGR